MRKYLKVFLVVTCVLATYNLAWGNKILVRNTQFGAQDISSHTMKIQFDISWENSWKDTINYDAAWVFIKYSTNNGVNWSHAALKTSGLNPADVSPGGGTMVTINVPTDKKGAFIYRTGAATGNLNTPYIQFNWDYGADGVTDAAAASAIARVMAIEMVYIPQAVFYAGGSQYEGQSDSSAARFVGGTLCWYYWSIYGESALAISSDQNCGTGSCMKYVSAGNAGEDPTATAFTIPAAFPKGYKAFYIMKYDITQGQYRDFLNMLTRTQQSSRVASDISKDAIGEYVMSNTLEVSFRNGIAGPWEGNGNTASVLFYCDVNQDNERNNEYCGEWLACNYLSWMDVCAYADWAGLRPMTELEYEKAAKGPNAPSSGEYAWGNSNIDYFDYMAFLGREIEQIGTNRAKANCNYNNATPDGPVRVGIFASSNTTRIQAGSSYYGVMELSGNLWKRVVTVGNPAGRSFDGAHGDGMLAVDGYANGTSLQYWPGYAGSEITGATGSGLRGGSFVHPTGRARISDRVYAASVSTTREKDYGGRLVRTAP